MKPFEILAHTADLRIKLNGSSLEELFSNGVAALAYLLYHQEQYPTPTVKREVEITANDLNSLLVDFLSEVLAQSEINKEVYWKVNLKTLTETALEAELLGSKVEIFDEDVKAITHHEAEIKKHQGYYTIILVLDI